MLENLHKLEREDYESLSLQQQKSNNKMAAGLALAALKTHFSTLGKGVYVETGGRAGCHFRLRYRLDLGNHQRHDAGGVVPEDFDTYFNKLSLLPKKTQLTVILLAILELKDFLTHSPVFAQEYRAFKSLLEELDE
ncbi:hypothetical protein ABPG72_018367 [Tetrahymena utriculariae]